MVMVQYRLRDPLMKNHKATDLYVQYLLYNIF